MKGKKYPTFYQIDEASGSLLSESSRHAPLARSLPSLPPLTRHQRCKEEALVWRYISHSRKGGGVDEERPGGVGVGDVGGVIDSVASRGLEDRDEPIADLREVGWARGIRHKLDAEEGGTAKCVAVPQLHDLVRLSQAVAGGELRVEPPHVRHEGTRGTRNP